VGGTEVNPVEQLLGKALTAIYERAQKRGIVASDLRHLAENHFELGDTLVRELMVPRTEMVWVERDKTLRQGLSLALRSGYSRIPVAGEDLDDIIGFAYVKDLAKRALDHHEAETTEKVEQHMRPPVFVPENKEAGDLLRDMQRDQIHLAIVVDEYGGTAGIITIEDIIEEIVGEIADEYDDGVESFTWFSDTKARAKASIHIEDLAEELKISIDEADYEGIDTIGGLMAQRLGRVPIVGSTITIDGWSITSERPIGRRRRISSVLIEKLEEAEAEID
jgi:CBS domain containing-hemolysin-like protein